MENHDDIKLVEVFAGEPWQATMIQNVLEANQIEAVLQNELMGTIEPWVISAGGVNAVKVIVSSDNQEQALRLIEEYNQSDGEIGDTE
ncbi:DUF2007-related protein [Paradesertivirga mongoliensis]|uniref:DUF2007-related protein n=1 Tax=Paradesertivirga mongoliensis TaxID=2100740 RepID=A0ABW4ZIB3_9SPHI|nr:DUF2007-related protein [Pedobacter mongoliensis]